MNSTLLSIYIILLCVATLVLAVWIAAQLVAMFRRKKAAAESAEEQSAEPAAHAEERAEAVADAAAADAEENADTVVLHRGENLTYLEAYAALDADGKRFADELIASAKALDSEAKEASAAKYASVKLGRQTLVRVQIKRGTVYAKIYVPNDELMEYAAGSSLKIKEKPIDVKVTDDAALESAKDLIGLTYRTLADERRRIAEERRARRRQNRRESAAAAREKESENTGAADALGANDTNANMEDAQ